MPVAAASMIDRERAYGSVKHREKKRIAWEALIEDTLSLLATRRSHMSSYAKAPDGPCLRVT